MNLSHSKHGFTLVELMVVIAIIGILAAAMFPSLGNYFDRARQTEAKSEMRQIGQLVLDAQIVQGKALRYITNSQCSDCPCRAESPHNYTGNLMEVSDTHNCSLWWKNAINAIALASGTSTGLVERYYRDPWNAPYLLDENESEQVRCDELRSTFGNPQTTSLGIYMYKLQRSNGDACI